MVTQLTQDTLIDSIVFFLKDFNHPAERDGNSVISAWEVDGTVWEICITAEDSQIRLEAVTKHREEKPAVVALQIDEPTTFAELPQVFSSIRKLWRETKQTTEVLSRLPSS